MSLNDQLDRIERLEARSIAYGIVLRALLRDAPEETRQALIRSASSAVERGLAGPLTDTQLEQIRDVLLSLVPSDGSISSRSPPTLPPAPHR